MAATAQDGTVRVADLEIRPAEGVVVAGGRAVGMSSRELGVLSVLASRVGRTISRAELCELVWDRPLRDGDRSVDVYVHKVRAKLEDARPGWRFIHTHVGFGYRFAPERSQQFHNRATAS
jgi:DNA-binding response OmpR family regulator